MEHPICEVCESKGIIREAKEIHHIRPISNGETELEMMDLAFNPYNLQSLCIECHHKIHKEMKK
ncbi:MAG: HNH endonuclease [Muribaculaceae bacterium]|nr:HNH endonuclease [Muribaculaceae bacterium]